MGVGCWKANFLIPAGKAPKSGFFAVDIPFLASLV
jgi:hypothetical protein